MNAVVAGPPGERKRERVVVGPPGERVCVFSGVTKEESRKREAVLPSDIS